MSKELNVPELGENIDTATVVEVFVKPGDRVRPDQAVLSLETDKAQFELPATDAGTVDQVLVAVGDDVRVGQAVLRLADGEPAEASPARDAAGAADPGARAPTPEGAAPEETRPAATAPAAAVAPPAPPERLAPEQAEPATRREPERALAAGAIAAAPSVRRLARELGVRLEDVAAATGQARLTAADVRAFTERPARPTPAGTPASGGVPASAPLPDFSKWGEIEIEEMSKIRRKTADNMARAWVEIPTVTHYDEADITQLDGLRKRFAPRVQEAGGHLTWTAILLHVVAGALRRFPQFNASVDMAGNRIIYKKYVHIGVAVDTERGLLVPVIHDADKKNIVALAKALADVSEAARGRNIKPDMMQGATFTITNLGGVGGVAFSPIVNPPQVAILGVSARQRPTALEGRAVRAPPDAAALAVVRSPHHRRRRRRTVPALDVRSARGALSPRPGGPVSSIADADLVVLGAGPGGYAAAFRAADLGIDVTLVDPEPEPGGVCLFRGCIPSKALLHQAALIEEAKESAERGIAFGSPEIDLARLRTWKDGVVHSAHPRPRRAGAGPRRHAHSRPRDVRRQPHARDQPRDR